MYSNGGYHHKKQSGAVDSTEGLPVHCDLYFSEGKRSKPLPVIIFLYGFKGFKDWGTPGVGIRRSPLPVVSTERSDSREVKYGLTIDK